jgi:hypothetical protein
MNKTLGQRSRIRRTVATTCRRVSVSPRGLFCAALLLASLSSATASAQPAPAPTFVDLVRRSGFIFLGTVKAVGDSTPTIPREKNTAVVVVDTVLDAQPPVGNMRGQAVTVRLRDPKSMRPGQRATFFTYVYRAGSSLGVEEVAALAPEDAARLAGRVRDARQAIADEALMKRLESAELVVVGVFGEAKPTEAARDPVSEHDPLWWRAPIRVESVLKGRQANGPVFANIAMNYDYLWALAPKPKAGQEGIFLLQPDREKRFRVTGLFLIDPQDVLPRSDVERVRRLLK